MTCSVIGNKKLVTTHLSNNRRLVENEWDGTSTQWDTKQLFLRKKEWRKYIFIFIWICLKKYLKNKQETNKNGYLEGMRGTG